MQIKFLTNNEKLIDEVNDFVKEWHSNSPVVNTYTSGSTGTPKQIRLAKEHMEASAYRTIEALNIQPEVTTLLCLSPSTIGGKMMITRSILLNANLIVADVNSNPLKNISTKIDFAAMVPLQVQNSLKEEFDKLKTIGTIIIGGGILRDSLFHEVSLLPNKVYQTFGMTETISHVALRKIQKLESPYKAVKGVTFESNENQLIIHAPHIGVNKLITNDRIELINSTSFNWLGRSDFVINSGGIKLHPEQIEKKIGNNISLPFFISGVPDPKLGERLILCVETEIPEINIIKSTFNSLLSKYETPKEIYFYEKFIRTKSDKINRNATLNQIKNAKRQVL